MKNRWWKEEKELIIPTAKNMLNRWELCGRERWGESCVNEVKIEIEPIWPPPSWSTDALDEWRLPGREVTIMINFSSMPCDWQYKNTKPLTNSWHKHFTMSNEMMEMECVFWSRKKAKSSNKLNELYYRPKLKLSEKVGVDKMKLRFMWNGVDLIQSIFAWNLTTIMIKSNR